MRVLVACEFSGIVRDAFAARGHDAYSCDLLPSERPGKHFIAHIVDVLRGHGPWDMMLAFPPCTHVAVSGAKWFKNKIGEQREALEFMRDLLERDIPRHRYGEPDRRLLNLLAKARPNHSAVAVWSRRNKGHLSMAEKSAEADSNKDSGWAKGARALRLAWARTLERAQSDAPGNSRRDGDPVGKPCYVADCVNGTWHTGPCNVRQP